MGILEGYNLNATPSTGIGNTLQNRFGADEAFKPSGRKLWEGGLISDIFDIIGTPHRAVGGLLAPLFLSKEKRKFWDIFTDPTFNWRDEIVREDPELLNTLGGRIGARVGGLALDVFTDPLSWMGGIMAKAITSLDDVGRAGRVASAPLKAVFQPFTLVREGVQASTGLPFVGGRIATALDNRGFMRQFEALQEDALIEMAQGARKSVLSEERLYQTSISEAKKRGLRGKEAKEFARDYSIKWNDELFQDPAGAMQLKIDEDMANFETSLTGLRKEAGREGFYKRGYKITAANFSRARERTSLTINNFQDKLNTILPEIDTLKTQRAELVEQLGITRDEFMRLSGSNDTIRPAFLRAYEGYNRTSARVFDIDNQVDSLLGAHSSLKNDMLTQIQNLRDEYAGMFETVRKGELASYNKILRKIDSGFKDGFEYADETKVAPGVKMPEFNAKKARIAKRAKDIIEDYTNRMKTISDETEIVMKERNKLLRRMDRYARASDTFSKKIKIIGPVGTAPTVTDFQSLAKIDRRITELRASASAYKSTVNRLQWDYNAYFKRADAAQNKYELSKARETAIRDYLADSNSINGHRASIVSAAKTAADAQRRLGIQNIVDQGYDIDKALKLYDEVALNERAIGQRLVDGGVIDQATADKWDGIHLRRIFDKFENPEDAIEFMYTHNPKEAIAWESEQIVKRKNIRTPVRGDVQKRKIVRYQGKYYKVNDNGVREEIPSQVMETLKPILEAGPAIIRGQSRGSEIAARANLLNRVADEMSLSYEEIEKAGLDPKNWSLVGREIKKNIRTGEDIKTNTRWGRLYGRYVPKPVFKTLIHFYDETAKNPNTMYKKLLNAWKWGKTAGNPSGHARNIMANMMRSWHETGLDPARFTYYMGRAMTEIKKDGPVWNEALESGSVFHDLGSFIGTEFQKTYTRYRTEKGLIQNVKDGVNIVGNFFSDIYQKEEQIGKLAVYMFGRDKGLSPQESAQLAEKALFNYAKVPPTIDKLRKNGWIPFATYPSKAIPSEIRNVLENPGRYTMERHAIAALAGRDDMTEEERETEQRTLPKWMDPSLSVQLPVADAEGRSQYLDTRYIAPFGAISTETGMGDTAQGLLSNAASMTNPLIKLIYEVAMNKSLLTGKEITTDVETLQKNQDRGKYIVKQLPPPLVGGYSFQNLVGAFRGERDFNDYKKSIPRAVAGAFVGLKTAPVDVDNNASLIFAEIEDIERKTDTQINKLMGYLSRGMMDDEEFDREVERVMAASEAAIQKQLGRLE